MKRRIGKARRGTSQSKALAGICPCVQAIFVRFNFASDRAPPVWAAWPAVVARAPSAVSLPFPNRARSGRRGGLGLLLSPPDECHWGRFGKCLIYAAASARGAKPTWASVNTTLRATVPRIALKVMIRARCVDPYHGIGRAMSLRAGKAGSHHVLPRQQGQKTEGGRRKPT